MNAKGTPKVHLTFHDQPPALASIVSRSYSHGRSAPGFPVLTQPFLAAFAALQGKAEASAGPAEDPPGATVEKTASQIDRAVSELRDAPFTASLLERMSEAGMASSAVDKASDDATRLLSLSQDGDPRPRFAHELRGLSSAARPRRHPPGTSRSTTGGCWALVRPGVHPRGHANFGDSAAATVVSREVADAYCGPSAVRTTTPTFFYMPHCEVALYEHLARANWGAFSAHAVVGNAFETTRCGGAGRETARGVPAARVGGGDGHRERGGREPSGGPGWKFQSAGGDGGRSTIPACRRSGRRAGR